MINQNDINVNYFYTDEWKTYTYKGYSIYKYPSDLLTYQQIIWDKRPDIIIETGTCKGGSSLFFLDTLKNCGKTTNPLVITIGLGALPNSVPETLGILKLVGSCLDPNTVEKIKPFLLGKKVMVSLDSNHTKDHVLAELNIYKEFVSIGQYLVVEDTFLGYYGPFSGKEQEGFQESTGKTPKHAVEEFLETTDEFMVDKTRNKYISMNPNGYLLRVK